MTKPTITFEDFEKVDIRLGTIIHVEDNVKARKPAYIVQVDFGDSVGIKQSSAQIKDLYNKEDLMGRQVICVVNFEPKRIAGVKSEILITGFYNQDNQVVLATVAHEAANGQQLS